MFIIVRHGNTFEADEQPRRIGARTDLPLTAKGKEQARALGACFAARGWRFGRMLVSPLLRTRQTAEAILAHMPSAPQVETADFLREVDHGPDENLPEEAVVARIGKEALNAWEHGAEVPPGWVAEPEARIAAWRDLFTAEPASDQPTLLVTSNGAARFALLADPHLHKAAKALPSLKLPTGGYGIVARNGQQQLVLQAWGERP
ncbi:histidine phosphatase family protein [Aurantiacibacter xanthus]|uniref:Histidine phosphatase family protein n=1 Tax=Aurantiacibacter xanthus TaxID=1784712 RepID=A0A3A1P239_9SPHN|nr:histidine phosphatase family protein [Aurantiacibacter xanthus]RIV83500.1 histidine phosphatase family protein [Aurantiacibacter xanthus]